MLLTQYPEMLHESLIYDIQYTIIKDIENSGIKSELIDYIWRNIYLLNIEAISGSIRYTIIRQLRIPRCY